MTPCIPDEATLLLLQERVGKVHLQQRLGIERDFEHKIFGQGRNLFHIENWYSSRPLIRNSLRLMLLHGRGRRNARKLAVRHNHITVRGLPAAFNDYTILQISDLHIDMAPDFPDVLIEVLRQAEYDLCVLTGDFRAETYGPYEATLEGMQQVCNHLQGDVYGVLGNHDTICMVPGLESMGVNMLLNEQVALKCGDDAIYLAGIDDPHYYRADNLEKAADPIPNDAVSILLAHSPEIYRNASHANFNVLLCGHTHAGQICLPGGIPVMCNARCPRAFCRGAWNYRGMVGYTSAGSGASIVDVRINCPPEITLHHLQCA
jgi:predicted MPP superfamily phosphohydrolase